MKRCPRCNRVFDDSLDFCTEDGTPLTQETFVLPSEAAPLNAEEETVIRTAPANTHLQSPPAPTVRFDYRIPPPAAVAPVIVEKRRSAGKYALFLVLGLILGGGLVLTAGIFAMFRLQNKTPQTVNTTNRNSTPTPKLTPTATPVTASAKHENRTDASDDEFNGRVISLNAYIRSSPNRSSNEIDVLPIADRLEIEERENENSPWFRVTCEHGTSGWMHGNTIEYTR